MTFAFAELLVYQKSVDFADAVRDLTEQFPARYNHLADQVNRASFRSHPTLPKAMVALPSLTENTFLALREVPCKNASRNLSSPADASLFQTNFTRT